MLSNDLSIRRSIHERQRHNRTWRLRVKYKVQVARLERQLCRVKDELSEQNLNRFTARLASIRML
jgi:hypothetical protein